MKAKTICQFCKSEISGDCYQRWSEYSVVTSCMRPECMEKADDRIEEIMEAEEKNS